MRTINYSQYRLLQDFYLHCYNVFHFSAQDNFARWADDLDNLQIPWFIQNTVSDIAQDIKSKSLYLSSLLKNRSIQIVLTVEGH